MRTGGRSNFLAVSRSRRPRPDNGHVGRTRKSRESLSINSSPQDTWRSLGLPGRPTTWNRTTDSTRATPTSSGWDSSSRASSNSTQSGRHHAQVADRDRGVGSSGFAVLRLHRLPRPSAGENRHWLATLTAKRPHPRPGDEPVRDPSTAWPTGARRWAGTKGSWCLFQAQRRAKRCGVRVRRVQRRHVEADVVSV